MAREIVFIGDSFYRDSKTMMSSIYEKNGDNFTRTDWGFVRLACDKGEHILIRPATKPELNMFSCRLDELMEELKSPPPKG